MPRDIPTRLTIIRDLEELAEHLTTQHLQLINQMEDDLGALRHTMHLTSPLRPAGHPVGRDLPDTQRLLALTDLANQFTAIEMHVDLQHDACVEMQTVIRRMLEAAADLRLYDELNRSDGPSA